jgi:Zn-dependent M32 family carboxypeptidase
VIIPLVKYLPVSVWKQRAARASDLPHEKNMKIRKIDVVRKRTEKRKRLLPPALQKLGKLEIEIKPVEWREAEEKKLLSAAKSRLPELKTLLASASDHWGYEDPIYRFYHHSFKVVRGQTTTSKIVEVLQSLAPHLKLNSDFLEIVAESTKRAFRSSRKTKSSDTPRAIIEAFFHAHHMLLMVCKYAQELKEPPPALPSGWATVLYLYNIR